MIPFSVISVQVGPTGPVPWSERSTFYPAGRRGLYVLLLFLLLFVPKFPEVEVDRDEF